MVKYLKNQNRRMFVTVSLLSPRILYTLGPEQNASLSLLVLRPLLLPSSAPPVGYLCMLMISTFNFFFFLINWCFFDVQSGVQKVLRHYTESKSRDNVSIKVEVSSKKKAKK